MTKCKTPLFPATPKGVVVSATRGGMVVSASLDHQTQCLIDARCLSEAESIREGYLVVPATLAGVVVSALLWCMVVSAPLWCMVVSAPLAGVVISALLWCMVVSAALDHQ